MAAAVLLEHVTKTFGDTVALDDVSIEAPRGKAVALLGPNGAGKTTALRIALGLVRPDRGTASIAGTSPTSALTSSDVGASIDRPAFYPYLTGRRNLELIAATSGMDRTRIRVDGVVEQVGLSWAIGKRVASYSTGMRQRLAIASALLGDAPIIVLDEPTDGLDPAGVVDVRAIILSIVADGRTALLSSHALGEVEATCSLFVLIDRGHVVASGALDTLMHAEQRIVATFASSDEAARACGHLVGMGWSATQSGARLIVDAGAEAGSALSKALSEVGLFALSITPERINLEAAYLRLLGDTVREGR